MRLLALLVAFSLLAPSAALAYPNEPGKLFGVAWGTPVEKIPGLKSIDGGVTVTGPGSDFYNMLFATPFTTFILPHDSSMAGMAVRPHFKFKRARLAAVDVIVRGPAAAARLRGDILRNFGKPDKTFANDDPLGLKSESSEWLGQVTSIRLLMTDRKSGFLKPEDNVLLSVSFIGNEFVQAPDERVADALKTVRHFVNLFLRTYKAEGYEARKKDFYAAVMNQAALILKHCDRVDAEAGRGSLTAALRETLTGPFYRELDATVASFERLPPGNPAPDKALSDACHAQCDRLNLVLQKLEKEAAGITAALLKR